MSTGQIAELHGIPRRTVNHAIVRGELKASKLPGLRGAYVVFPRDVDRWLKKRADRAAARAARKEAAGHSAKNNTAAPATTNTHEGVGA